MPFGIKKEKIEEIKTQESIPEGLQEHCLNFQGDDLFLLKISWKGKKVSDETFNAYAEEFKNKTLRAKEILERKEVLPEDLKIFEGKINIL